MDISMDIKEKLQLHTVEKIYEDTYVIKEKGYEKVEACIYLLVGNEKALLIDSGFGFTNLKSIIAGITDKPVICVCTHGHHDHILGACQFEETYIHSREIGVYKYNCSSPVLKYLTTILAQDEFKQDKDFAAIARKWANKKYAVPQLIDNIEYFELGNRKVTWYPIPGHTQGSIALFDEKYKTAFDSDAASRGIWLYLRESSQLKDYIPELEKYCELLKSKGIIARYTGHSSRPVDISDAQSLLACCKKAFSQPELASKFNNPFRRALILHSDGSSVIFKK